jgi:hypothetical protein
MDVKPLGTPVLMSLKDIHPSPTNPRKIPQRAVEVVAASLREFGWQQPLVVDSNGELIVGHTRFKAARLLKLKHAPVLVADGLTPEQVRAYRIADNRTGDYTSWDLPELARELDAIGDQFRDVLGLADWDGVMEQFETIEDELGDEEIRKSVGGSEGFDVVVTFPNKELALQSAEAIFELGALDVRHKRG